MVWNLQIECQKKGVSFMVEKKVFDNELDPEIQKVRDQHMGEKPEMLRQIDDHLRSHLDKKDRWMIAQAKQKLHML